MKESTGPSGEALVILAALAANQLAQGKDEDQLTVLAAFLTVLADNLALIAARRATKDDSAADASSIAAIL